MFVVMYVMSGVAHFRRRESYVAYARGMGAPGPDVLVPSTGLMILVGGLLIGLGLWADLGALLIAAFYLFNQFGPEIGFTIGDGRLFPEL